MASANDSANSVGQQQGAEETRTASAGDTRVVQSSLIDNLLQSQSAHNFKGTPAEVWGLMTRGQNASMPGGDLKDNHVIHLRNWYLHRVTLVDPKSGEITHPVRTVLFDANGDIWHFVSEGIATAIAQLVQAFGTEQLDPPVAVKVIEIRTRSGYKTLSLVPA